MKNSDIIRIENNAFAQDCFDIRWRVTSMCNYRCDFCIQGDHDAHLRLSKGENARTRTDICRNLRRMTDSLEGYRRIKLSLIGGEVTILNDFPQILKTLSESPFNGTIAFDITTNFSPPAEYYAGLAGIIEKSSRENARRSLRITASFYSDYISMQEFIEKMRKLQELLTDERFCRKNNTSLISLSVVCPVLTDKDFEDYLSMRSQLPEPAVRVDPLVIRAYKTSVSAEVRNEMMRILEGAPAIRVTTADGTIKGFRNIQALGEALSANGSFCPEGYYCDAGIRNIWINAFGDVYRCPCIGSDMILGSILNGPLDLLSAPAICNMDHCSCSQFGIIEKY